MIIKIKKNYTLIIINLLLFLPSTVVEARSLETGEKLFLKNCNVCHVGGNNIIIPEKNLRFETLKANGMDNLDAIIYQVTNGKNGMPAFGGRLNETQIEKIANYILYELPERLINY